MELLEMKCQRIICGLRLRGFMRNMENTIEIRIHAQNLQKKMIDILFAELEIPTMNIFGNGPIFTLTLREQDGTKILNTENQTKLKIKNITVTILPDVRAKRAAFVRCVICPMWDPTLPKRYKMKLKRTRVGEKFRT